MAEDEVRQEATAREAPTKAAQGTGSRDPIVLVLIVLLVVVYVVGQWLVFSVLDAKLEAIQQRVVDTSSRIDTKVDGLEGSIVKVRRALKAVRVGGTAPAPAAPTEGDEGAQPEAAASAASPGQKPGAPGPGQPAKPAP
jgi:hypothetical protein